MSSTNNHATLTALAPLLDGLLVAIAGWLAYFTRWDKWNMQLDYLSVLILGTGLVCVILPASGAYRSWRGKMHWRHTGNTVPGLLLVAVILMAMGTATKTTAEFSRLWMGYWFCFSLAALFLFRLAFVIGSRIFSLGQARPTRVLIVGEGPFAQAVAHRAESAPDANWEIAGFIAPHAALPGDKAGTSLEDMEHLIQPGNGIDEVWIAMDNTSMDKQEAVISSLQRSCLTVRYIPDLSMLALLNHVPTEIAGMTVIDLNASPLSGHNTFIKTCLDKLIASVSLLLLAPLLLVIAIAVKLNSPGPILYRQQRHGWDGKVIQVLKFRTMFVGTTQFAPPEQAHRNDPRVTSVGRVLRRTSLDELPQFVNVLLGDMSIVGPRPHPLALNENYVRQIDAYMQRHRVKPGITGWAQIHGLRGETESLEKMRRRLEYDLFYIEHWSLWLDIKIITRTLFSGWTGTNAY